jgi:hypothetical protein
MIFFDQDMRVYLRCGPRSCGWPVACAFRPSCRPSCRRRGRACAVQLLRAHHRPQGHRGHARLPAGARGHGWIEIAGGAALSQARQNFFERTPGDRRAVAQPARHRQEREHLYFIQNLVADIGHNVIVPNMTFKLFFQRCAAR